MVHGTEVELHQVFLNLVGNAMKFTDSGSITIRVQEEESAYSGIVLYKLEVEDSGIVAENSHMLFEAFQQGERSAVSRQHKGTGLGLTISKDFVELMGGKIRVDGTHGKGSRFYFTLDFKSGAIRTCKHYLCGRE